MRNALLLLATAGAANAQQVADSGFAPPVPRPAYREGAGPLVLLDEAHNNFHTTTGRYLAFARLARRDGYRVSGNSRKLSRESLAGARILVIANALADRNANGNWSLPTPSAFDASEVAAVRAWVRAGGSLLLIADHMPFPGAMGDLAEAFGVRMMNGFAMQNDSVADGIFTHTRAAGAVHDHPVTRGRSTAERIDSVKVFTGQGFRIDRGSPLLTIRGDVTMLMPVVAWQFSDSTPRTSARGLLQGAAIPFGRGRVAVFAEAAMFSAQRAGPRRNPMGMNDPAAPQNPRFLLNVLHWLSGLL
ncbi:MAG TPA: DUF4350 domain-containing protein [Gemmatimonadaceae bacterium]|nr:DUF4350 domain-containing protein [Gemmatimonadaceae bacterium]